MSLNINQMKTKKNDRVNLDKKRNFFFLLGLIVTLGATLMAFEWRTDDYHVVELTANWEIGEMDQVPITRRPEPPKPKVKRPAPILEFEVVEDVIEVPEIEWIGLEYNEDAVPEVLIEDEPGLDELVEFWDLSTIPSFIGGEKAMFRYIKEKIVYPKIPKMNNVGGKVFVYFVVNKEGEITDVKVERGVDPYLDKEALRVIESMPNWSPGKQRGKPVNVSYILPINFKLYP